MSKWLIFFLVISSASYAQPGGNNGNGNGGGNGNGNGPGGNGNGNGNPCSGPHPPPNCNGVPVETDLLLVVGGVYALYVMKKRGGKSEG